MSTTAGVRVAILDDYQSVALTSADWSALEGRIDIDVYHDTLANEDALVRRLGPYQIICAMRERTRFTASLLDRLPKLRFIATTGPRNAGIDVVHARTRGVVVSGTGGRGNPTLEHIWALILATVRYVVMEDTNTKQGKPQWQTHIPMGLAGKTLGLVGLGNLGTRTAKIAQAFGVNVVAWSPNLTPERAAAGGATYVPKEELFRRSDIVSIHMVLSERTRRLITSADLALMKPTAFLINTSRGPIVDEEALIEILQQRRIAGAGLDVFNVEPLPADHPLRRLDNATLTPHTGYVSDDNYATFWSDTVDNIVSFLNGNPKRVLEQ